jgi:hypothetical protein
MVDWQVTATTIYCDAVDDEVTLLVYQDGSAKCTGYKKYAEPEKEIAKIIKKKSKQLKRQLGCEGAECSRVTQYRDGLFAEEAKKGASLPGNTHAGQSS